MGLKRTLPKTARSGYPCWKHSNTSNKPAATPELPSGSGKKRHPLFSVEHVQWDALQTKGKRLYLLHFSRKSTAWRGAIFRNPRPTRIHAGMSQNVERPFASIKRRPKANKPFGEVPLEDRFYPESTLQEYEQSSKRASFG